MCAIATATQVQRGKLHEATAAFRDCVTPVFKQSQASHVT
jgi:hypothetical protein